MRDAGRYDGVLGVLCAIEVAEALGAAGGPLEVVAFADEEGARYGVAYLGSAAYCGRFDPAWLELEDADGVSMARAIEVAGGDVAALRDPTLQQPVTSEPAGAAASPVTAYIEVHIEQGPVLESEELPVGVVTAIVGQTRELGTFTGQAGHAGTVPPTLRADALAGAAEFVLAVEETMLRSEGLMATVGRLTVEPGVGNVIPGRVELSVDLRHAGRCERGMAAFESLGVTLREIAERRRLRVEETVTQQTNAVPMDAALGASLEAAIEAQGLRVRRLVSGAGHDAAILGREGPAAMLFVRCAGGVSHSPNESVAVEDVAVALEVITHAAAGYPATALT